VAVIGCGLSQEASVLEFIQRLLLSREVPIPTVLDADALNHLTQITQWWDHLEGPAILTPHPGEMARLLDRQADEIQANRLAIAKEAASRWRVTVVLKGAFTVVASPSGVMALSPFANPGLATAGTGDVLAGVIGGLVAQGLQPFEAACCGVYLHGAAGEEVRRELGDTGMIASDLLPLLPRVIQRLRALGPAAGS
jgi:NAD(P)H-hydrate epimerase